MGTVIRFPVRRRHAQAPFDDEAGKRSGRSSLRETPVSRSIGRTNSAGTPRFDFVNQYQTWPCVVPISLAKRFWPPARSQASLSAPLRIMESSYPFLGGFQPKSLSETVNRKFGSVCPMVDISPKGIGKRIAIRRKKLGLSQPKLAEILGCPQQTIDGWEHGKARRPRLLLELSKALCTTQEWLLREEGPEEIVPAFSKSTLSSIVESLDPKLVPAAIEFLRKLREKDVSAA
jgi:transcriptional regulator with XRE-family HTH domain